MSKFNDLKSRYSPLPGFLIAEQFEEKTHGAMVISENMSSKDSSGIVVAIGAPWKFREGDKEYEIPCPVKVGDKIIFKNMGTQMYLDFTSGKQIYLMKWHDDVVFTDIMAIIND